MIHLRQRLRRTYALVGVVMQRRTLWDMVYAITMGIDGGHTFALNVHMNVAGKRIRHL